MPKRRVAEPTAQYAVRRKPTNLSLEAEAIVRGEAYARQHGVSLSALVNQLLRQLPPGRGVEGAPEEWPTAVARLYGSARGVAATPDEAVALYRDHLARKHREDA
jgi:hypothetical protein